MQAHVHVPPLRRPLGGARWPFRAHQTPPEPTIPPPPPPTLPPGSPPIGDPITPGQGVPVQDPPAAPMPPN